MARSKRKSSPSASSAAPKWDGKRIDRHRYAPNASIFAQGDAASSVMFIEQGVVRLSVVSHAGKEAIIGMLDAGHFFGEGCLAGQARRMATATAVSDCTIVSVSKSEMTLRLQNDRGFADQIFKDMLSRNIRLEEDLIDQLFNSTEKRLARTLLLLARFGEPDAPTRPVPKVSQEMLAEMIGTTRTRVNFFMNQFRKLGLVEYDQHDGVRVNNSLLGVVLRD
jgi:CRP/FNR family transcriptional regulator, cyclic AMP receptor protein